MIQSIRTLKAFVKGVFRGKRKEAVAMETYLGCIPTIQTLIDKHLLGINLKERLVVIDLDLHLMYISIHTGKAMEDADRRYAAFMDKVVAYMNFQLGRMGAREYIDPTKETIRFLVTQKVYRHFDENGDLLPAHLQVSERTLFVGMFKNGKIDYREYGGKDV